MVISMMPSIWTLSQYLDQALWQALFPDLETAAELADSQKTNYVERMMLDAASTAFNVIFPLILVAQEEPIINCFYWSKW